jgi:hypothetical protein
MSRDIKLLENLSDTDLWGISCALQFCLMIGYFEGSDILWCEIMLAKISTIRELMQ